MASRIVALKFHGVTDVLANSMPLADRQYKELEAKKKGEPPPKEEPTKTYGPELPDAPLAYVGVDAQYFASALIPQNQPQAGRKPEAWLSEIRPMIVGEVPENVTVRRKVDCTCRLTSMNEVLDPGKKIEHDYQVFVGPKQPRLLDQYGGGPGNQIGGLVYYGWFGWVARPMVAILESSMDRPQLRPGDHYADRGGSAVHVPAVAQAGARDEKMQELQPEMKKINEKYKTNAEEQTRATQELWRKHNYNPMGGCLLVFVQLPIFMGLYRSLMVNVELRRRRCWGTAVRWCSNLAAPDMFWNWQNVMPDLLVWRDGWLGPYLNILPLFTVSLFIWQQIDVHAAGDRRQHGPAAENHEVHDALHGRDVFKVASGLCLYFIASSLWGIAERKLLPKTIGPAPGTAAVAARPAAPASTNGHGGSSRKKQRGRRG